LRLGQTQTHADAHEKTEIPSNPFLSIFPPAMKIHPRLSRLVVASVALALSGCVSARYKTAAKNTPPAVAFNLTSTRPAVEATVNTVIIFHGPGAWKRDAYWDEYVVSVANHGSVPLIVDAAALTDFCGDTTPPGDNPWLLEKASLSRQDEVNRRAKNALVQIGQGYVVVGVSGVVVGATVTGIAGTAAAGGGAFAASLAGVAILPFYIGGTVYRNISSRHDIENEFAHRRLILPATVAPGGVAQGSLFFRISPGPQRLVLSGRSGAEPVEVAIELTPLKGLHLLPAAGTPPPATGTPQSPGRLPAESAEGPSNQSMGRNGIID
jgi:hypothetical protein